MSAETAPFPPVEPVDAPAVPTSPRGGPMHWGALAGGACALGGAAMLASIAFGHLAQRHTTSNVKTEGRVSVSQEAQLANRHSPDAAADNRAAALTPGAASSPVRVAGTSGSAPASRRRDKQRKDAVSLHERHGRSSHTPIATQPSPQLSSRLSRIEPTNYEVPQIIASANAQQTSPKPSSAGPYSPPAPSQLGTDEYAPVTLSAGTHLRSIAPPSRPASSINPPATSGTEWINHMSQRRVTEVPNQFVK